MRATVRLGERALSVSVERRGANLHANVNGREYRLDVLEAQRGVYSFLPQGEGGRSVEAVVSERDGAYRVRVRGRVFEAVLERPDRPGSLKGTGPAGPKILRSVMPGRVVRVLVEPGQAVKRGQGILVVEAMKMQNELGSPGEGIVTEVRVAPGDRVEAGAALAVIG